MAERSMSPGHWLALVVALALSSPALAQTATVANPELRLFERPATVQHVKPASETDPVGELTCSFYPDMMIRESGTDTPAPGPARLVPIPAGARRPPCGRAPIAGEIVLETADFSLLGKKGPFLVFNATDPNGAVPFLVLDAGSGRVLYRDSKSTAQGIVSVRLDKSGLHLGFRRGLNGACSILQDKAACWARMVREADMPPAIAHLPAPMAACEAAYRDGDAPADDPSIVSYDVELTLNAAGQTQIAAHGPVGCEPVP